MAAPLTPTEKRLQIICKGCLYTLIILLTIPLLPFCIPPDRNEGERMLAVCHMKELYLALERFRAEYGSYPCDATADIIAAQYPGVKPEQLRGNSSNAYLRQLFYMAEPCNERLFYARLLHGDGTPATREGDNQLGEQALEAGENAMGYVLRLGKEGHREAVTPGGEKTARTPLLLCPLYPEEKPCSGDKLGFDAFSFRARAFILYTDGSVHNHEDDCKEDERDEDLLHPARSFFPALPDGQDSAAQHLVLPPLR